MFAGIRAAQRGMRVQIFEQNEKLGKKLFINREGAVEFYKMPVRRKNFWNTR